MEYEPPQKKKHKKKKLSKSPQVNDCSKRKFTSVKVSWPSNIMDLPDLNLNAETNIENKAVEKCTALEDVKDSNNEVKSLISESEIEQKISLNE